MKPAWPRSLIARILLAEAITIVLAALLLPALMIGVLHRTTARYQDRGLVEQAQEIASAMRPDAAGGWRIQLSSTQAALYATGYDGRAFILVDAGGHVLASSLFAGSVPWRQAPRLDKPAPFRAGHFIGVSLPVAAKGMWIIVSQDENGPGAIVDDVSRSFLSHYLRLLLPILLLLPLINSLVIRRLVVGVRRVSRSASAIGAHSLHNRLDDGGVPSEIAPLIRATNLLIERLEISFRQQGEFVANVAHELRTPLAALRVQLDSIGEPSVRLPLDRQIERLSHVLSQLRDLASLERLAQDNQQTFDLRGLAIETISDLAPAILAQEHRIELLGSEETVETIGNRTLIGLALVNLIRNGTHHTPAGTTILVTIGPDASITVEDDGPGIATLDHDLLVKRFWRADRTRSDSAGIGLSIVQRIVDVHRGTLSIANRAQGGAAFTMRFHLAEPSKPAGA